MKTLEFFDSYTVLGRLNIPPGDVFETAESLRNELDRLRIKDAVVYHAVAAENNPLPGNKLLMEAVSSVEGLHPQWIVMPHHTGEMPSPEELVKQLKSANVTSVRVFPGPVHFQFRLNEFESGELLEALNDIRLPLFVEHELIKWSTIDWILNTYPKLPLVLTFISYRVTRNIYPLMKKFNSLYIGTSRFLSHQGVKDFVDRFGPEHLLFATRMPYCTGGGSISHLTYADIPEGSRALIASGNIKRLFGDICW